MNSTIFDNINRNSLKNKTKQESLYQFYNRTSRVDVERVRNLLDQCLGNFPVNEQQEILSRLRSNDDVDFNSTCFELLLHETLIRKGYILKVHPDVPNSNKKPDFFVISPNKEEFYLEAKVFFDESAQVRKHRKINNAVIDYINKHPHKNFWIRLEGEPKYNKQAAPKVIKKMIHNWLDTLDPDNEPTFGDDSYSERKIKIITLDDWSVKISAVPQSASMRGNAEELIGSSFSDVTFLETTDAIKAAVELKAKRYGELDKPYVLALNCLSSFGMDHLDERDALFGYPDPITLRRYGKAVFYNNGAARNEGLSSVWMFRGLVPNSINTCIQNLYINPFAKLSSPIEMLCFPSVTIDEKEINCYKGESLKDVFGFPELWPSD
ncbi:MAG: hypothetical protein HRU28_09900 [Rhizobiales bacterium]|nr:hypothetical protein [Hyphomicrobiales bacterium]